MGNHRFHWWLEIMVPQLLLTWKVCAQLVPPQKSCVKLQSTARFICQEIHGFIQVDSVGRGRWLYRVSACEFDHNMVSNSGLTELPLMSRPGHIPTHIGAIPEPPEFTGTHTGTNPNPHLNPDLNLQNQPHESPGSPEAAAAAEGTKKCPLHNHCLSLFVI